MKRWTVTKHDREQVSGLASDLQISPIVAALLISRGYETPEKANKFLNPSLEDLHEPFLLKDMQKAVTRVLKAIDSQEKILVWGDYDVDGTTGTVVLRKALEILGAESGFLKLLVAPDKKLLGVHALGQSTTELIHIGLMVMLQGGTIDLFIDAIFNYPTLSELYKYAAYDALGAFARQRAAAVAGAAEARKG